MDYLVAYVVGLTGDIIISIGQIFTNDSNNAEKMWHLTIGIYGENGGLLYWINDEIIWLLVNVLAADVETIDGQVLSLGDALRTFLTALLGL